MVANYKLNKIGPIAEPCGFIDIMILVRYSRWTGLNLDTFKVGTKPIKTLSVALVMCDIKSHGIYKAYKLKFDFYDTTTRTGQN